MGSFVPIGITNNALIYFVKFTKKDLLQKVLFSDQEDVKRYKRQ